MAKHTRAWFQGHTAQQRWAKLLVSRGNAVLPAYAFEDVDPATKAPVMMVDGVPSGLLVTPDCLAFSAAGRGSWHEVKSKSVPSWRRMPPGPRWEHGFDYSLIREYCDVERRTGQPVFIVVREERSPAHPFVESELSGPPLWLHISLSLCLEIGQRRDWPKRNGNHGDLGRNGEGGWLWPRHSMTIVQSDSCVVSRCG